MKAKTTISTPSRGKSHKRIAPLKLASVRRLRQPGPDPIQPMRAKSACGVPFQMTPLAARMRYTFVRFLKEAT